MKKIMILGAGLLQSYVIKRAKELGYYTIAVDMDESACGFQFADEYKLISITKEKECFDYAVKSNIDGILTAATDYGVLSSSYISEHLNLPGIKYNVAKTIKNKFLTRQKLLMNNLDEEMQFFEASTIEEVKSISGKIRFPVMVKPCDGSGSKGVSKVENINELLISSTCAMNNSLTHKALIESFVEGKEYGAESFVYEGKVHILGIMEKIMTKPPCYAELGHMIPSGINSETEKEKEVKKTIVNAINALGIDFGSVNMDFLMTSDNKICIVDIGARMGGNLIGSHIIPFSTGIDYVGNIIKAAVGDKVDFTPKQNLNIASSILSLTPGKVKKLPKLCEIISSKGIMDLVLNLKTGDIICPYCNNLDGCGYVVAAGDTAQDAMDAAIKAKQKLDMLIERENYV